jgi:hypothetical protein
MTANHVIFRLRSDGSFVWVETLEDILMANKRLEDLAKQKTGEYHLWDSSSNKFINLLAKSAPQH